jgi:hypothetical protein
MNCGAPGAEHAASLVRQVLRSIESFASVRLHGPFDLFFDSVQIEARALLHWRKFDGCLGDLGHLLLHEDETPELVSKPVQEGE